MAEREVFFKIFIGIRGTGKTYLMKKFLEVNKRNLILPANEFDPAWNDKKYVKVKPTRKKIIDPNDVHEKRMIWDYEVKQLNKFKGNMKLILEEDFKTRKYQVNKFLANPKTAFNNGLIIIDDFKNYIHTKGDVPREIRRIFNDGRHRAIDVMMASHSFQDINASLVQFNPTLYIFKTTLPPNESVRKKIANYKDLERTIARVNQRAKKNKHYFETFEIKQC